MRWSKWSTRCCRVTVVLSLVLAPIFIVFTAVTIHRRNVELWDAVRCVEQRIAERRESRLATIRRNVIHSSRPGPIVFIRPHQLRGSK